MKIASVSAFLEFRLKTMQSSDFLLFRFAMEGCFFVFGAFEIFVYLHIYGQVGKYSMKYRQNE